MNKIDKQAATEQIKEAELYVGVAEYHVQQLPRTPGRLSVERSLQDARRGIGEIKREAEID